MKGSVRQIAFIACSVMLLLSMAGGQSGAPAEVFIFDAASARTEAPVPFPQFSEKSPNGHELAANSQYLTLDGKPWLPVMGEFHYSRYPEKFWEEEIQKMKAGGVNIVATYVIWIHHEEVEGKFDWTGQRNLRRFVELCAKNGMYVSLRIGPWAHGEARNGGFPDWLLKTGETRKNNPVYLGYVRKYYGEIAKQIQGLTWKEGGPIVNVQLENEYVDRGPGAGASHIIELKKIANQVGITAPLYTVTGWMNPEIPGKETLPVFAGYPDAFWDASRIDLPPSPNYFFSTARDDGGVATDLLPKHPSSEQEFAKYPFLTAEAGGGMEAAYHRRPALSADDIAAIVVSKLGSGANSYGYYMFQGGTNPDGKLSTLQESQATGYWNDLPIKGYDYQSPLGEYGQMHPSFRRIKPFHYFLNDFGALLAPMQPVFPDKRPKSLQDKTTLRSALRFRGNSAFLFVNNYQRIHSLASHDAVQFELNLPGEKVVLPSSPVGIRSGAYFIWPVNLDLNGAKLKYSTAQPLVHLENDGASYYFFVATDGIATEFLFDESSIALPEAGSAKLTRQSGRLLISGVQSGRTPAITFRNKSGKVIRIVVLSEQDSENAWVAILGGQKRLLFTAADFFCANDQIHLRSRSADDLGFDVFPRVNPSSSSEMFEKFAAKVGPVKIDVKVEKRRDPTPVPKVNVKRVAEAPDEKVYEHNGVWKVSLPQIGLPDVSDIYLQINYVGDVGRVFVGKRFLTDNFYNGKTWEIGLKRVSPEEIAAGIWVGVLPLRKDAPIYLPANAWPEFPVGGQIAEIRSITAVPEYEVSVQVNSSQRAAQ